MTLYYRITGARWYQSQIAAIIASSKRVIEHQISIHGEDGKLLMDKYGGQRFWNSVQKGVDLRVENIKPYAIRWGDLKNLLKGLTQECWLQTCVFEFSVASGTRIGGGALYKA